MQSQAISNSSTKIRRSRAQWQAILQEFEQSGLSVQAFCQQNNIAYSSLAKWRSLLKQENNGDQAPALSFIELPDLSPRLAHSAWRIELDLGAGVILRLTR